MCDQKSEHKVLGSYPNYGELTSPGYPLPFTKAGECIWKIRVNSGEHIQFQILDVDLEDAYHINCGNNFVQVFGGINPSGNPLIQRYCGFHKDDLTSVDCQPEKLPEGSFCRPLPQPVYSLSNQMVVEFQSDGKGYPGKGFSSYYQLGCGGSLYIPSQFSSPDYPNAYPKKRECIYNLYADSGNRF